MGIGYEEGIAQGYENGKEEGYTNGKIEKAAQMTINLLIRKLGFISENTMNKINASNEEELDQLSLNIFDINREEDVLKYIH